MNFRVGQKVVCVDPHPLWRDHPAFEFPKLGEVYTIRDLFPDTDGVMCLRVHEIRNSQGREMITLVEGEPFFRASRFRPLIERETDISVFTALLNPTSREVERV